MLLTAKFAGGALSSCGGSWVMAALGAQLWLKSAMMGRKQQPFSSKELKRTLEYLGIRSRLGSRGD